MGVVFSIAVVVYSNTLTHGFVYDDSFFHCKNEYLSLSSLPMAFTSPYSACAPMNGIYRPLPTVSFIITLALFGNTPLPLHLQNILLHGLISALIVVVLKKTLAVDMWISGLVGVLFAVLPIHTSVVANIKSRDELLATLCFLLMWMAFERGRKRWMWYGVSAVWFTLALFSKEVAMVYPVIVLSLTSLRFPTDWKRIVVSSLWFFPGAIVYWGLRSIFHIPSISSQSDMAYIFNPLLHLPWYLRVFSGLDIFRVYLEKTLVPVTLSETYHYAHFMPVTIPWQSFGWVVGLISVGLLCLVAWQHRQHMDAVMIGIVVFILSYLPISQLVVTGGDVMAERWMYLPSFGLLLIVVGLGEKFFTKKRMLIILGMFLLVSIYAVRTYVRNPVWASNKTLFLSMTRDAPKSVRGHVLLGRQYLLVDADIEKADTQFRLAYSLYPDDAEVNTMLGQTALMKGNAHEARKWLEKSSLLDSRLRETDRQWAKLLYVEGDYTKASAHITRVISSGVYDWNDVFTYAAILAKVGAYDQAQQWLLRLSPEERQYTQPLYLHAVLLYKAGKKTEALGISWNTTLTAEERRLVFEDF